VTFKENNMKLTIFDDSKNYTAQVIRLTATQPLSGLDRLVGANIQGNLCLIGKDYPIGNLYLFFPAGTILSPEFLSKNNLYRESDKNVDQSKAGYFDNNGRVRAIAFKGNKATGFVTQLSSLSVLGVDITQLKEGDEFNEIGTKWICKKYIVPIKGSSTQAAKSKLLDNVVDKLQMPEHIDTNHLLKYLHSLELDDHIVITTKLHGTSGRVANTLVRRQLTLIDKIAKFFGAHIQTEKFSYCCGSHHVIKSVDFQTLKGKNHFYSEDLWSKVSEEVFRGKLHEGEHIYFEIIGKEFTGKEIQKNYSYGLARPDVYVYRISHINGRGIEIDLSWRQVKARCNEMAVKFVPEIWSGGTLMRYMADNVKGWSSDITDNWRSLLETHLRETFMDKPSKMDPKVIEEGICIRKETYPRPHIYKMKAPLFVIHETKVQDADEVDIEEQN
jgi:hypothetical protein